jgi:hypothetical protein
MLFWNKDSAPNAINTRINSNADEGKFAVTQALREQLLAAEHSVFLARRRILGAGVLLLLSGAFLPWILDSAPRPWREDVILLMPKNDRPHQAKNVTAGVSTVVTREVIPSAVPIVP